MIIANYRWSDKPNHLQWLVGKQRLANIARRRCSICHSQKIRKAPCLALFLLPGLIKYLQRKIGLFRTQSIVNTYFHDRYSWKIGGKSERSGS